MILYTVFVKPYLRVGRETEREREINLLTKIINAYT